MNYTNIEKGFVEEINDDIAESKFTRLAIDEIDEDIRVEPKVEEQIIVTRTDGLPTICLNMIVKNESKVITRLLQSVLSVIDCYCICDTGSTDNTKEIIKDFFKSHNIPGKIVDEPFRDFAYNRNFALKASLGMSDYNLLMDADMVLSIGKDFSKSSLNYECYSLFQGHPGFYYKNSRIVKNNENFCYVGVTHEYVSYPNGSSPRDIQIKDLFINDIGDGGAKADKYERDIRLLKKGLEDEPNNKERYTFYLANSYFCINKWEDAITYYKLRIQIGGWIQEIWQSHYKIGLCYKNLGKIEKAIYSWMEAYHCLPKRIENLVEIISHYRNISKQNTALVYYKLAKDIVSKLSEKEKNDHLFLENEKYMYSLSYEYSIIAMYNSIFDINDELVSIFNNCKTGYVIENTLSNMKFYKDILKPIAKIDISSKKQEVIGNTKYDFCSSSSSMIPYNGNYLINVRYVNYTINRSNGSYNMIDNYIITVNNSIELSKGFKNLNEKFISSKYVDKRYIGIEDIRIFQKKDNSIIFSGTDLHKNDKLGISIGEYKREYYLESEEYKTDFNDEYCEKNWVFVNYENELHVVYGWNPLQICKVNETTKTISLVKKDNNVPHFFNKFRGSTSGFEYKDEIWFIVHIVSYESPRHYYHAFVIFDNQMNLKKYSAPFKFEGESIEYSLSLIVEDDRILIPYSTWDSTSIIGVYNKKYIEDKIKYTFDSSSVFQAI
jgi:tetratricopeptide (TPR) repeat protein